MGNYIAPNIKCDICGSDRTPDRFVYIEYSSSNVDDFIKRYPLEKDGNPFPPLEVINNICKVKNLQIYKDKEDIYIYHIMCEKCVISFKIPFKLMVKNYYWIGR
ncbi:MAG TPA: hypothetical protein PKD85_00880 [Saprospiraceae bacterium]|nr:hypothetical protein [Saprospiraceae bacterium]